MVSAVVMVLVNNLWHGVTVALCYSVSTCYGVSLCNSVSLFYGDIPNVMAIARIVVLSLYPYYSGSLCYGVSC